MIKYKIYPSVLDAFNNYLCAEDVWMQYWGNSENPSMTLEDFQVKTFNDLMDTINRVESEPSEPASRGTCFNEIVDCLIAKRKPDFPCERVVDGLTTFYECQFDGFTFRFPLNVCSWFAKYYDGAMSQVKVSAVLDTCHGDVELYGYIDELMPLSVHDIKTTGSYSFPKFKDHAQHLVYPYCLRKNGNDISRFEYNILLLPKYGSPEIHTEVYVFDDERDIPILRQDVEDFIDFLEINRRLITNKKIFNNE